jgi:hypothetical protein
MTAEIDRRLGLQARAAMLPWTVFDAAGRIVGMTTYMNVDVANRRVEIGSTWYAAAVQRSPLNTQCKRLLLAHAFDTLDCIAVEFRTHRLNTQSRGPSSGWVRSSTACCVRTRSAPMARCATPRCTASRPSNGRRCAPTWTGSWPSPAEPVFAGPPAPPS